jgi:hypothetical protein
MPNEWWHLDPRQAIRPVIAAAFVLSGDSEEREALGIKIPNAI